VSARSSEAFFDWAQDRLRAANDRYSPALFRVTSRVDRDREKYQGDNNQQNSDKSCHD
jgi:hypothetical protein